MPSRPEGGSEASRPYFFLSYAHSRVVEPQERFVRDELVGRFANDLANAVLERASHPRAIVPASVDTQMPLGAHWRTHLAKALATCRTFVALYSAEYFDSPDCGMEWSAFADRISRDYVLYEDEREAFVPVLWLPVRDEAMPSSVKGIQYLHADLGLEYHRHGLRYLMTHRELRGQYEHAVEFFANRVIRVAENHAPSPTIPPPLYQELRNAFTTQEPAESTDRPKVRIVVAAPRISRLPDGCDPDVYGVEAYHWRPYLPDYEGEIAQTAKRLAESLHYRAFIESAERSRELIPITEATAPTILLVDPWAVQQPILQQRLSAFDRHTADKGWIRLVILWNRANPNALANEAGLETMLERTLARTRARCRRETPRAADGLDSVEDLITDLPPVIWAAERRYLDLAETYPRNEPGSQPLRERLSFRVPGLGSGGLRPANALRHDEPRVVRKDRP
ncbi:MAG TPA: TIR-like protein FxsC [Actinocrinis sp.]|nr:TIR-like protein FxsC [Actinocrinis sp.]